MQNVHDSLNMKSETLEPGELLTSNGNVWLLVSCPLFLKQSHYRTYTMIFTFCLLHVILHSKCNHNIFYKHELTYLDMYRINSYKKFLLHLCCAPLLQLYRMYVCVCVLSCVGVFYHVFPDKPTAAQSQAQHIVLNLKEEDSDHICITNASLTRIGENLVTFSKYSNSYVYCRHKSPYIIYNHL